MTQRVRLTLYAALDITEKNWPAIRARTYGSASRAPIPSTPEDAAVIANHLSFADVLHFSRHCVTIHQMAHEVDDLGFTLDDNEMRQIVSAYRMDGVWSHVSARSVGIPFADAYRLVLLGYMANEATTTGHIFRLTDAGKALAEHIVTTLKDRLADERATVMSSRPRPALDRLREAHEADAGEKN